MMNYTKLILDKKMNLPILIEDLEIRDKKPAFILADRFEVYALRVLKNVYNKKLIAYMVRGRHEEKLFVFLKQDYTNDFIVSVQFRKKLAMDREIAKWLGMALLIRLRDTNTFHFDPKLLPDVPEKQKP